MSRVMGNVLPFDRRIPKRLGQVGWRDGTDAGVVHGTLGIAAGRIRERLRGGTMIRTLLVAAILAGCGSSAPAFDPVAVRANFTDECRDPIVVDDLFCQQVRIGELAADGSTLVVPTTLNAAASARAGAICSQLALARFDATGEPLGFDGVRVLDMNGERIADC